MLDAWVLAVAPEQSQCVSPSSVSCATALFWTVAHAAGVVCDTHCVPRNMTKFRSIIVPTISEDHHLVCPRAMVAVVALTPPPSTAAERGTLFITGWLIAGAQLLQAAGLGAHTMLCLTSLPDFWLLTLTFGLSSEALK